MFGTCAKSKVWKMLCLILFMFPGVAGAQSTISWPWKLGRPCQACDRCGPVCDPSCPSHAATPSPSPAPSPAEQAADPSLAPVTTAALGSSYASIGAGGVGLAGGGSSAAGNFGNPNSWSGTLTNQTTLTPLILPGLFTAISPQSVVPLDRVTFGYGYFDGFNTVDTAGNIVRGFNLNIFTLAVEKTVLDGMASVYVSAPALWATQNVTGQEIDGIGDISAGFKCILFSNPHTGSLVSGGLTVTAPTGESAVVTATATNQFATGATPVTSTATTEVNPTFIQPWAGCLLVIDQLFVEGYLGVVIPTDDRVATLLNSNINCGYNLYRNPCGLLTWITPVVGLQTLLPLNHTGAQTPSTSVTVIPDDPPPDGNFNQVPFPVATTPDTFSFETQVFLSGIAQIGIGQRAALYFGVVTPIVSPRGYDVGAVGGLTYLY